MLGSIIKQRILSLMVSCGLMNLTQHRETLINIVMEENGSSVVYGPQSVFFFFLEQGSSPCVFIKYTRLMAWEA